MVSGGAKIGALDTESLEEHVQTVFRKKDDRTTVVHKWIADVQHDALKSMTKACREDGL